MPLYSMPIMDAYQCIVEPPDFWAGRLAARFRDQTPRVATGPGGGQAWAFEGGATVLPLSNLLLVEERADGQALVSSSYDTMRPGCYKAAERIKDMDMDGADVGVVFPSVATHLHQVHDPELYKGCVRAYNDAILDWCKQGSASRLFPVAVMPILGADEAAAEARRVAKLGFKAILFVGWPNGAGNPDAADETLWAACEETQLVVCVSSGGASRPQPQAAAGEARRGPRVLPKTPMEIAINNIASGCGAPQLVGRFALRGVFERFPKLKVLFAGTGAGWLPYFLEQVDGMYWHDRFYAGFNPKMLPSEYLRRNTKLTLHLDASAMKNLDDIGVDNLLWASYYPLETCDWPNSKLVIESQLRDVPEKQQEMVLAGNAAGYFGIEARSLQSRA